MKFTTLILGFAMMLGFQHASAEGVSSRGKGYAGVEVRAPSFVPGTPGIPVEVQIDYMASRSSGAIEVAYATEGGLTLRTPARKQLNPDSNGVSHDRALVQANSPGAYFLNVFVKTRHGGEAISVPITIGSATLKPQAASSVVTPNGQRVIEMPAQETVR
jgi:hypothetical protein